MKMHSQVCSVCSYPSDGKVRCGAVVCSACKTFFIRIKRIGSQSLKCSRGTNDCKLVSNFNNSGIDGRKIRQICPKCRYAKCLNVKMIYGREKNEVKSPPTSVTPPSTLANTNQDLSAADDLENRLAIGFNNLALATKQLPGRTNVLENPNDILNCFLSSYRVMACEISKYGRSFDGFSSTMLSDRCRVFMKVCNRIRSLLFSRFNDAIPMGFNWQNFSLVPTAFQGTAFGVSKPVSIKATVFYH